VSVEVTVHERYAELLDGEARGFGVLQIRSDEVAVLSDRGSSEEVES
jgi:hypothetical protein